MNKNEPFGVVPPEYEKAVRTTYNILEYADNTEKKLREKLIRKGYAKDAVDYAIEYAKRAGALNDRRFMERCVEQLATVKLYGRRRIANELYVKGFRREDIASLDLSEYDFAALCAERIRKTARRYPEREKMYASLVRYGYTSREIAQAFELAEDDEEA